MMNATEIRPRQIYSTRRGVSASTRQFTAGGNQPTGTGIVPQTLPGLNIVMYPRDDTLEDALLAGNCDGVAGNQLGHLLRSQAVELIAFQHLSVRGAWVRVWVSP